MEDHQSGGQDSNSSIYDSRSYYNNNNNNNSEPEPVRSRWTPKPEQILILESIFNSGMVNPPKDETVRIRKLLEKFGSVGDANVFYWFQNRRSRTRRRQRQIQAATLAGSSSSSQARHQQAVGDGGTIIQHDQTCSSYANDPKNSFFGMSSSSFAGSSSSSSYGGGGFRNNENGNNVDGYFGCFPNQMGFQEMDHGSTMTSLLCSSSDVVSNMQQQYQQAGLITVFINGVPTEIPRGPLDIKAIFGQDLILVHSSGIPVPTSDYGYSMQSLQHGESYFLVSRFS